MKYRVTRAGDLLPIDVSTNRLNIGHHEQHVPEFSFSGVDGPTAVARDGEVDGQHERARFSVRYRALPVFSPGFGAD